jgi:hypothetical protein
VKDRVGIQVAFVGPEVLERDAVGVPQEPGRLVVEGGPSFLERADAEQNAEALALSAQRLARWRWVAGLDSLGR